MQFGKQFFDRFSSRAISIAWPFAVLLFACFFYSAAWAQQDQEWIPESDLGTKQSAQSSGRRFADLFVNLRRSPATSSSQVQGNVALDHYHNGSFNSNLQWVVSGRVDLDSAPGAGLSANSLSLSLREAYLTAHIDALNVDIGRINIRDGVALGYNPSDVFRSGSLLARRTEDPARLRESRLGVVGLQARYATDVGNFSGLIAPKISVDNKKHWYDPQLSAVNGVDTQTYFKYTAPRWNDVYSSLVLHRSPATGNTLGINSTGNIGQHIIAYIEYAKLKRTQLPNNVDGSLALKRDYTQVAFGASYSTERRQTWTLEYQHNGAGLGTEQWRGDWQSASPATLTSIVSDTLKRQDPLAKKSVMALLQWDQLLTADDDLTCLARANLIDKSRLLWCEWRYKLPRSEWSMSGARLVGAARSEFGAAATPWLLAAKLRLFY